MRISTSNRARRSPSRIPQPLAPREQAESSRLEFLSGLCWVPSSAAELVELSEALKRHHDTPSQSQ